MAYLDSLFFTLPVATKVVIIALILLIMALVARKAGLLTANGILGAVIIGFITTYIGGLTGLLILLFFFLSAAVIGHIVPRTGEEIQKKKGKRDIAQVFANGVPALLGLMVYRLSGHVIGLAMFASSLAEATADTWEGEIGRLSKNPPVSIISFTAVPKGLSGGVSPLGTVAGMVAAFLVSLIAVGCYKLSLFYIAVITLSGFLGSLLDSILGATIQVHYRTSDGKLTENEYSDGEKNERARGIPFVDNDAVNFLSGLFSSLLAFGLSRLF